MSFIHQDIMIQLLEGVGRARRQELLSNLQFDVSDRSFPQKVCINQIKNGRDHHLISDYDHRDLENEINGGDDPCRKLTQLNRQLTQEGDMRVFFDKDNSNLVVKIIRKRPLECNQGIEAYSLKDENGDTLQIQADEILLKGEPEESSEDIYDHYEKIPFDLTEQKYISPMDKWDVILDATEVLRDKDNARLAWSATEENKEEIVAILSEEVYSANVYPTLRDKRYSNRLKERLSKLNFLDSRGFISICGAGESSYQQKIENLRKQSNNLPLGKGRAKLLLQIQSIKNKKMKEMKASVFNINILHNIQLLKKAEVNPLSIDSNRKKSKKKKAASKEMLRELDQETLQLTRESWKLALSGTTRTLIPKIDTKVMWNLWNELIAGGNKKATKSRFKSLLKKKLLEKTSKKMSSMSFKNKDEKKQQALFFQLMICHTIEKAVEKLYGGQIYNSTNK